MTKWVAVTGANGFIGRVICRLLKENGWQIRALLRNEIRARSVKDVVDEPVYGDLADFAALEKLTLGACALVHCAGAVRGASQQAFDRVNVDGVRNLVEVMDASRQPPRLLCMSSLAAREPRLSFYAASKRKSEWVLEERAGNLDWSVLRPPAVYGPGDRELLPLFQLMAKGIAPVPGNKDARFSMIYVDDLARLVEAWLHQGMVRNGVYSLHDGKQGGYSWLELSDTVARLCQRPVRQISIPAAVLTLPAWINRRLGQLFGYAPMLTPGKLRELYHPDWVCDNQAIEEVLSWRPQVQLEEGLRRTPGWCPSLQRA